MNVSMCSPSGFLRWRWQGRCGRYGAGRTQPHDAGHQGEDGDGHEGFRCGTTSGPPPGDRPSPREANAPITTPMADAMRACRSRRPQLAVGRLRLSGRRTIRASRGRPGRRTAHDQCRNGQRCVNDRVEGGVLLLDAGDRQPVSSALSTVGSPISAWTCSAVTPVSVTTATAFTSSATPGELRADLVAHRRQVSIEVHTVG